MTDEEMAASGKVWKELFEKVQAKYPQLTRDICGPTGYVDGATIRDMQGSNIMWGLAKTDTRIRPFISVSLTVTGEGDNDTEKYSRSGVLTFFQRYWNNEGFWTWGGHSLTPNPPDYVFDRKPGTEEVKDGRLVSWDSWGGCNPHILEEILEGKDVSLPRMYGSGKVTVRLTK